MTEEENQKHNTYRWMTRGFIISPISTMVVIVLGGGGHGISLPAIILYPALYTLSFENDLIIWLWLLLQFPAIGLLLDIAMVRPKMNIYVMTLIAVHVMMVLLAAIKSNT